MIKHGLCCLIAVCLNQIASAQSFKTDSGWVKFTSSVPLHSFSGTSEHLVGRIDLDSSIIDFYVDLTTLETGNSKRDKDMRRTLNTDEYPFAGFYGKLVTPFNTTNDNVQVAVAEGEFSIHGVSQNVEIDGTLQKTAKGIEVKAEWIIRLEDYDIEPPGILFYRVNQEQKIEMEALLKPSKQ